MRKAAAVVIGVDRTGGLTPLKSAARGAREVADWLTGEGFVVTCLTDGPGQSVTSQDVSKAIANFATNPPTYDFLLVYFSGHGQWHTRADHWLLSGAPQNTAEAINLEGAMYTARLCGIPNVVFISDACRTIPKSLADNLVSGIDAFPNHAIGPVAKVDYFKATSDSRPAYEVPIGGSDQSVLTRAILSAFENPEPQIIKQIPDGGQTLAVIPNRLLESVLQARVDELLDGVDGNPTQDLDTNVPSADNIYIARVRTTRAAPPPPPPPPARPPQTNAPGDSPVPSEGRSGFAARRRSVRTTPGRAAAFAVAETLQAPPGARPRFRDRNVAQFEARLPDPRADHFETETGFIIRGARLGDAVVPPNAARIELFNSGNDPRGDAVKVDPRGPALPVAVRLRDGRCVVLAALRGYLGHATFNDEGLANVSYVPSSNSGRWAAYQSRKDDINELRALVAVAVEHNSFSVKSEREAVRLGERIRVDKALDPTLGLYAAYAFAEAGIDAQVRDILGFMRQDLDADLFDVLMLAGYAHGQSTQGRPVPFCPMLTQGWNLLRAYGVELPGLLAEAKRFLSNSLWTTFSGRGASIVFDAVRSGALK